MNCRLIAGMPVVEANPGRAQRSRNSCSKPAARSSGQRMIGVNGRQAAFQEHETIRLRGKGDCVHAAQAAWEPGLQLRNAGCENLGKGLRIKFHHARLMGTERRRDPAQFDQPSATVHQGKLKAGRPEIENEDHCVASFSSNCQRRLHEQLAGLGAGQQGIERLIVPPAHRLFRDEIALQFAVRMTDDVAIRMTGLDGKCKLHVHFPRPACEPPWADAHRGDFGRHDRGDRRVEAPGGRRACEGHALRGSEPVALGRADLAAQRARAAEFFQTFPRGTAVAFGLRRRRRPPRRKLNGGRCAHGVNIRQLRGCLHRLDNGLREQTSQTVGFRKGVALGHVARTLVPARPRVVDDGTVRADNPLLQEPPSRRGKVAADQP